METIPDLIIQLNNNRIKIDKLFKPNKGITPDERMKFNELLDQRRDIIKTLYIYTHNGGI